MSRPARQVRTSVVAGMALLGAIVMNIGIVNVGAAQERTERERVVISGRVLDEATRVPLEGVMVHFVELNATILTDQAGQFEVQGIPLGVYQVEITHQGYRRNVGDFTVAGAGSFVTLLTPLDGFAGVPPGRVIGRITDGGTGDPVVGVEVKFTEMFMQSMTNEFGRFEVPAVPPGRHAVEFSSLGYATRVDTIDVVSGKTSDARVRLSLDPVEIEPIEVTVEARDIALEASGFYNRRNDGFGEFIDRETIEKRDPGEMTDLFTGVPGVRLEPDPYNPLDRTVVLRGGRLGRGLLGGGAGHCYPFVVLDGIVFHRGGEAPANLDRVINPETVAGIEIFPSAVGVPIQFSGIDAACGVIMIWTRR